MKSTPNTPIITFLQRTWMLLIALVVTDWLAMTEMHFQCLGKWVLDPELGGIWIAQTPMDRIGPILWVLPFCIMIFLVMKLLVHLSYRKTIDADANSGLDVEDWKVNTPFQRTLIRTIVYVGLFIGLCVLCSNLAKGGEVPQVDQAARWDAAVVSPKYRMALDVELAVYKRNLARYETIQNMRPHGVPAPILFCLHYRESSNDFHAHAHEGSSLMHRTRDEPKGRPLHPEPPYTFEQSAEDAYYICEKPPLDRIDWTDGQAALDKMESFNGFGYRKLGVNSPYLWSGTSIYTGGKYVRDGVFSRTAMDGQLGCCAILKHFMDHGVAVSFVEDAAEGERVGKTGIVRPRYSFGLRDTWECGSARERVPPVRVDWPRVIFRTVETARVVDEPESAIIVPRMPIIDVLPEEPTVILVQK